VRRTMPAAAAEPRSVSVCAAPAVGSEAIPRYSNAPRAIAAAWRGFIVHSQPSAISFANWSAEPRGPFTEIVRRQGNFSPQGSTSEIEDCQVNLDGVSVLSRIDYGFTHGLSSPLVWWVLMRG
jgi:hypothetical protein